MLRSLFARMRRARRALAKAAQYACEPLEQRQLLSTINWINRGNDGFGAFGTQANVARGVVDAAIARWERVINNFNYGSGYANVFNLTVEVTSDTGNGAVTYNDDDIAGKPDAATIKIDAGSDGAGGKYYFDPTPMDDWEFQGTQGNAFFGRAFYPSPALNRYDFLTLVTHEMGHAMGISTNFSLFSNLAHDTGVADNVDNPNGIGDYWAFVGPSVKHLFTGFNSNGPTDGTDSGGPTHSAPAGAQVSYGGQTYKGVADLMTPYYSGSSRATIPDTMVLALKDAYGYTVTMPETFGTFYANFDSTTGALLVQGGNALDSSNDNINVYRSGSDIVVSVDIGNDVPGTGAKPSSGSLPAFVSRFPAASVTSIDIEGNDGDDVIGLGDLYANIPVTINGGSGDDSIYLNGPDLGGMQGHVWVDGGDGNDSFSITDSAAANQTYTVDYQAVTRSGAPWWKFYNMEDLYLRSATGASVVNLLSNYGTTVHLIGTTGGNIVNIGNAGSLSSIQSPVYVTNPDDFTTLNVDGSAQAARTVTIDNTTLSGIAYSTINWATTDISSINITTGAAVDTVNVLAAKVPLNITTADGADSVNIGRSGSLADITKTVTVDNIRNYSDLKIDDSADTAAHLGILSATALTFFSTGAIHWDQNDLNSLTILGGTGGNTFTVTDTPYNWRFVSTELTTGTGNDTVNVQQTHSVLNIHGKSGHDTVNLGDGNGVQDLHGEVNIDNASNYTTINVNDTGNTAGRSVTISNAAVTGLCPADINYHGSDLWALNVTGGSAADSFAIVSTATNGWSPVTTVTGGPANDIFNVQGTTGPLVINGGGGLDTANIGNAGDIQSIAEAVSISDPPANSYISVNIDDSADASADAGTLTATALSGLSPGTISWSAANLNSLSINGGSGGNKFTITDTSYNTHGAIITLNSGSGPDKIEVQGSTGTLIINTGAGDDAGIIDAPFGSNITFNGGAQASAAGDSLAVVGAGGSAGGGGGGTYTPSSTTLGSGAVAVGSYTLAFNDLESLTTTEFGNFTLRTPNGADTVSIDSPAAGQNRVSGTSGGVGFQSLTIADVGRLILDLGTNDTVRSTNSVTISQSGLIASGLSFMQVLGGVGTNTVTMRGGPANLDLRAGKGGVVDFTALGNSAASFVAPERLRTLTIGDTARVALQAGGVNSMIANTLAITDSGKLDIQDNPMVIQAAAGQRDAVLKTVSGYVASARNTSPALWLGHGLTDSKAANDSTALTGLGVIANADAQGTPLYPYDPNDLAHKPGWQGLPVDANSILVKHTWNGDADLSGKLDASDYFLIDKGFLSKNSPPALTGWYNGDFDFSGKIDASDYFLIDKAFLGSHGSSPAASAAAALAGPSARVKQPARKLIKQAQRHRHVARMPSVFGHGM